ncbi:MAG: hypothetical protein Q8P80_01755 [Candidatus Levybacteria bacterium]|nr:hypothetical protein [Candidatus Levybacteria bacterium]
MNGNESDNGNRGLNPLDLMKLPAEFKRFNDILDKIGPEKISIFLNDFHQISATAENDPKALSKLIEAIRDLNILFGGFIGRRVRYKGYKYLDGKIEKS